MLEFLQKIFGSSNERVIKKYRARMLRINQLSEQVKNYSDEQLQQHSVQAREQWRNGASLESLLELSFAVVREASTRVLGMRHFDVQIIGGMALHEGTIAEMRTGEGKTLVATLPVYLNALTGQGVHVVTVNDYLASRDAQWMGQLYQFLGLSVGINLAHMDSAAKRQAYAADITYGTNNEFGFDFLRDNMVYDIGDKVQRGLKYAVIDEVDSILIDEARTPLIISGQADDDTALCIAIKDIPPQLTRQLDEKQPADYTVDEKTHQVFLTEQGHERVEQLLANMGLLRRNGSLYDAANISLMHHISAALRAYAVYQRDHHYVVQDNQVIIVDEFTGRLMQGRRWSDGLHQAVEAKENVAIQHENRTLASITFQNYFRMYEKLSGMTGTADTEAYEFSQIYGLNTVVIPTHRPMVRQDAMDRVYRTAVEKDRAVLADIRAQHSRGQPILVGTTSIENSEKLSRLLTQEKLPHQVLNAKQHAHEALIVAEAGRSAMITIATNMAGRGTDIVLGGNPKAALAAIDANAQLSSEQKQQALAAEQSKWQEAHDQVVAAGGLHIIGTERHESRRIDNQLRGRSGRQGDPGSSRFYLSLEDPLLRVFAGDRVSAIMQKLNMPEDEPIEHPLINRALQNAQRRVEAHNFDLRKHLLEYDDVANEQRKVIYQERDELLTAQSLAETMEHLLSEAVAEQVAEHISEDMVEDQWQIQALEQLLTAQWGLSLDVAGFLSQDTQRGPIHVRDWISAEALKHYHHKREQLGADLFGRFEKALVLQTVDNHWRDHLSALDHLRQGIHLRGYAQKNPKQEYKKEAFELFETMMREARNDIARLILTVHIQNEADVDAVSEHEHPTPQLNSDTSFGPYAHSLPQPATPKVGRNETCPCGSGKKYKHCHGRLE